MISGIYKITNILNNEIYIGSAQNLRIRKNTHFNELLKNTHFNLKLQRSYNKYGFENFEFSILEYCDIIDLLIWYLDNVIRDFNAGSTAGLKMKPNVREALRKARETYICSDETRKKMSIASKGRKFSEESKAKALKTKRDKYNGDVMPYESRINANKLISEKKKKPKKEKIKKPFFYELLKGNKLADVVGEDRAKEICNKMSESMKGKKKGIKQSEEHLTKRIESKKLYVKVVKDGVETIYKGIKDCAKFLGIHECSLHYYFKNNNYIKKLDLYVYKLLEENG